MTVSKVSDKSKDQVRYRRERNLVAKNNKHKGGYHTSDKYNRLDYDDSEFIDYIETDGMDLYKNPRNKAEWYY